MSTVWKALLGLAVVLPLGAYVAGSLAASAADDPRPRHTIQIRQPGPGSSPAPTRSSGPEVVVPGYHDLGDDHGGDRHGGDDHGGRGHG